MTQPQIAAQLGVPLGTVKARRSGVAQARRDACSGRRDRPRRGGTVSRSDDVSSGSPDAHVTEELPALIAGELDLDAYV